MSEPAPPAKKTKAGGYIVLQQNESGLWAVAKQSAAKTTTAAVKEIGSDGVFVAIPDRSWKPVQVTARTETKLLVEAVKP